MKGNRLWAFGSVAAMALVLVLGWFLGVSPKLAESELSKIDLQSVEQQNTMLTAQLVEMRELDAKIDDLETELKEFRDVIPGRVNASAFVDTVQAIAVANALGVRLISIAEPQVWGEGGELDATNPDTGAALEPLPEAPPGTYTVAVTIQVQGAGVGFTEFARVLQSGERLFLVADFAFDGEKSIGTLSGFLFVIPDAGEVVEPSDDTTSEPTPTPTPSSTETPNPTETPTPTETPAP